MKPTLLFDEMYDGKDVALQKHGYEAYSVKKLRKNQNLQSDYSIIKLAENEDMILITEDSEIIDACVENKIPHIQLGQNPEPTEILEKLNTLRSKKPVTRRQKIIIYITTIVLASLLVWQSFQIGPAISNLSYDYREFIIAISGASAGIGIMFLKKKRHGTIDKKFLESAELLMFFITPTALSFPLLPNGEYKFATILVIYFGVTLGWFGLSLVHITRGTSPEFMKRKVKYAIGSIYYLWSYLMAIGFLLVFLFLVIHPLG